MPFPALILVVDDDARSVQRLAVMLREDGYRVEVAVDGDAAIERLGREPRPSILVTDLRMGRADGGTVARFARERLQDIPIVVVTGYPHLAPSDLDPKPVVLTKPLAYLELSATLAHFAAEKRSTLAP